MRLRHALCCAIALAFALPASGAEKTAPKKTTKAAPKKTAKKSTARPGSKPARVLIGKTETLACRLGTEDRHARIAVVLIGGKVDSFAYYSKWKPRTCSIYLQRNRDHISTWSDKGAVTSINAQKGQFLIEHGKGQYKFVFRDVDRERYCGMDGQINGTLTIRKGSEACQLTGIMEEGTLLGQAYAQAPAIEQSAPATAAPPAVPVEAAPPHQVVQRRPEPALRVPPPLSD